MAIPGLNPLVSLQVLLSLAHPHLTPGSHSLWSSNRFVEEGTLEICQSSWGPLAPAPLSLTKGPHVLQTVLRTSHFLRGETPCNAAQATFRAKGFHFPVRVSTAPLLKHHLKPQGFSAPTPATPGSGCLISLCWCLESISPRCHWPSFDYLWPYCLFLIVEGAVLLAWERGLWGSLEVGQCQSARL